MVSQRETIKGFALACMLLVSYPFKILAGFGVPYKPKGAYCVSLLWFYYVKPQARDTIEDFKSA